MGRLVAIRQSLFQCTLHAMDCLPIRRCQTILLALVHCNICAAVLYKLFLFAGAGKCEQRPQIVAGTGSNGFIDSGKMALGILLAGPGGVKRTWKLSADPSGAAGNLCSHPKKGG